MDTTEPEKCQSCDNAPVQWVLHPSKEYQVEPYHPEKPYYICTTCLMYLMMRSLSPEMYRNLLVNGHSSNEFLIHEDFYDDDGNALQGILR